ncbi:hypothetical protein HRG_014052 [Hirsutella rhossiliensis]
MPRDIQPRPTPSAAATWLPPTPRAAGHWLPQGVPSAVSASGKSQRAPREIRPLPTVEAAGPSPPPTRSSDVPRDIRPQPTWRAAGPSPPTRSSDAPRDIQALSTPTAAGRRLPQGGPSAVSASGKASAHRGKSGLCRRWRPPGLAAADEKFGRSAGYSATTDLEGRRPFAAVKRD